MKPRMRVTIRRVEAGVAAASTLLVAASAGTLGCAAEEPESEEYGLNDYGVNPGSAQLEIQFGAPGQMNLALINSTTDEFVRVGENLKMVLPGWLLWETLYPSDPVPDDARLKQLKATVKVSFIDKTKTLSSKSVSISTWSGSQYGLTALTTQFKIPAKTDTLKLTLTIKDAANASASATLSQAQMAAVAVFGGDLPNKSLLFDNDNGTKRERVIDGDALVKGSTVSLGYSDWRADQIVDKTSLNLQIGKATFSGRFGPYTAPIFGTLSYQVSYGAAFDDGNFQAEKPLAANTASRTLGPNRTAYEGTEKIPAGAAKMLMYGHVKAYLKADYSKYQNVTEKWYADNAEVLLKDAYDNPSGSFSNYVFTTQ